MATLLVCSSTDPLQGLVDQFAAAAATLMPDLKIKLWPEPYDADDVIAVAAWHPPTGLFGTLPNLRLVASIAAGTEHILRCPDLPADMLVTRIEDPDQARGMAEYVLWAALHYHRGFDQMARQQSSKLWVMPSQAPISEFRVGILGLGLMGKQVAFTLRDNGFTVSGWARSAQQLEGITCFAGDDALAAFLAPLDLVVCLLPLTQATRGICNAAFFAQMKKGAAFVNVGRGEQVVLSDLTAALDSGHLRGAVLDVFAKEPLAEDDALWTHPRIVLTPHMASSSTDATITAQILDNVLRVRQGQQPLYAMDRQRGY